MSELPIGEPINGDWENDSWYLIKTESCGCKWYRVFNDVIEKQLCCSHHMGHPLGRHFHPVKGNPFARLEVDLTPQKQTLREFEKSWVDCNWSDKSNPKQVALFYARWALKRACEDMVLISDVATLHRLEQELT